ncbi:TorF family putative porin [Hyphococcus sp.]|uniref:TorF family putative porin n=1 Tax=Hyphococcus sp. TaxID=2038636 RepID=UPI0035C67587
MLRKLACALALSATVIAPAAAEELSVSTTVGFESRYLFRGVQFAETSFQPSISLGYGNFYGTAWLNLPIGDDDLVVTPGGEELDLVIGYSAPISEVVSFDVGVTYYTFPDLMSGFFDIYEEDGDGLGANTIEPYVGLAFDIPLSPSVYVYHDFMFDTTTIQGNASYSIPMSEKTSFDLGGYIGYVIDDTGGTDYIYGTASANVSYAISDNGSFYAGVRYGGSDIPGGSVIDDSIAGTTKSSAVWWGLGFSASF